MDGEEPTAILKRDALGRVTLPRERREALIAEFERSGLKGSEFARVAGINYGTFASWMQDRRHTRGDYGRGGRRACAAPAPAAATPMRLMEVVPAAVLPQAAGTPLRRSCLAFCPRQS